MELDFRVVRVKISSVVETPGNSAGFDEPFYVYISLTALTCSKHWASCWEIAFRQFIFLFERVIPGHDNPKWLSHGCCSLMRSVPACTVCRYVDNFCRNRTRKLNAGVRGGQQGWKGWDQIPWCGKDKYLTGARGQDRFVQWMSKLLDETAKKTQLTKNLIKKWNCVF